MKSGIIWLTGLSGSGKTTIANEVVKKLREHSIVSVLLDGDEIRNVLQQHNFDKESRIKHNLHVGKLAALLEKQQIMVVVAIISPYENIRNEIRKQSENFIEVYVAADLETCIRRDPKGLYKKALAGEIKDFTGITAPYYPPKNPEIKLDTANFSVEESSNQIISYLLN